MDQARRQVLAEIDSLCIARVARIVVDSRHVTPDGKVTHYHGYAVPMFSTGKGMIWFQMKSHIRKHIHIGPVKWDVRPPTIARLVPRVGAVVFGAVAAVNDKKNLNKVFRWWSSQGEPIVEFSKLLRFKSRKNKHSAETIYKRLLFFRHKPCFHCRNCKHPVYLHQFREHADEDEECHPCFVCGHDMLESCSCPPCKTFWPCEDLWVVFRMLSGNYDVPLAVLQNTSHGHSVSPIPEMKGIHMSYDPIRFVFLTAWFCRSRKMLESFFSKVKKADLAYPENALRHTRNDYSLEVLSKLID